MSTWFKKELGDAVMAAPALETLKEQYAALYGKVGSESAQVFVRYDTRGGLHCDVTVYFSPGAEALATLNHAETCAAPEMSNVSLLVGD